MMGISPSSALDFIKDAGVEVRSIRPKGRPRRTVCPCGDPLGKDERNRCGPCQKIYLEDYHLNKKYGITREQRDALIQAQGGRCGLCDEEPKVFVVDHCHETGVVRGMLCVRCNLGLGRFGDNVAGLERAIAYLERGLIRG